MVIQYDVSTDHRPIAVESALPKIIEIQKMKNGSID
jgi:hypothetical protein